MASETYIPVDSVEVCDDIKKNILDLPVEVISLVYNQTQIINKMNC